MERNLTVDYVLTYVPLEAVCELHSSLHGDCTGSPYFDLSLDGIPDNKSSGLSIDLLSLRFIDCRTVYTLAVLQPARKGMGIPDVVILDHFLEDYKESSKKLRRIIADAPKRAGLQGIKQHSGSYSCPYCTAKKVDKHYPTTTIGAPIRTDGELRRLAAAAEDGEEDEDILQGVKGESPLSSINIDLIRDVPSEKMHLCDLGVVRKIMQLSFKCPAFKNKDIPIQRSSDSDLSQRFMQIKVLPQFARRTRPVDLSNYKAEEFRNTCMFYWPAVADTVPTKVAPLWLLTTFAIRAACLPDDLFDTFSEEYDLEDVTNQWYLMFQRVFSVKYCSYNVHVFGCHLHLLRELGPVTETSAVCFESHYNTVKKSYRPGTPSTGQQALVNSLLATRYTHFCKKRRVLTA